MSMKTWAQVGRWWYRISKIPTESFTPWSWVPERIRQFTWPTGRTWASSILAVTTNFISNSSETSGTVFSAPAFADKKLYYGAVDDTIKAFSFNASGKLNTTPATSTSRRFSYPGATPSISGSTANNMIVWATENTSPAVLHAYSALNLKMELYNSNQAGSRDHFGNGNKYITPTIANGKVYVGTTNGVGVFGLLP